MMKFRRWFPAVMAVCFILVAAACGVKKSFVDYIDQKPSWQQAAEETPNESDGEKSVAPKSAQ